MYQIEEARTELNSLAKTKALTEPQVLKVSRKLDILLNEYNRYVKEDRGRT
ncbi:aspartyl-phosphate phosphatase Spo0E family protein [Aneurinibacillus aneurinilyticus]|uniref:aspartyl-phosphate phosphatase Spo0E family protein n=1 Tax=Aneurinibacillus aneurinilyticus TaxID=1391 RepID=UPI00366E5846